MRFASNRASYKCVCYAGHADAKRSFQSQTNGAIMRELNINDVVAISGGESDADFTICTILGGVVGDVTNFIGAFSLGRVFPGSGLLTTVVGTAAGGVVRQGCIDALGDEDEDDDE
jgi:hypothetical protein